MVPLTRVADFTFLDDHLRRFVVPQQYEDYTPTDHDTWRRIMSLLHPIWLECAHSDFLAGLEQTGISLDAIPHIEAIDTCLQTVGWHAVTVDGYVPPEVFMGLQVRQIIPIARDIRCPQHLEYTPAPDIVHEAAAHVPMLINPDYSRIVQRFGDLSLRAGFNDYDQEVYEAVRVLSDIKEDRNATPGDIAAAEAKLMAVTQDSRHSTEPSSNGKMLTRLYWWTIEYGLVGEDFDDLKIYGAGLLSSVSESANALRGPENGGPELVPLDASAFHLDFDITRPQPQLFVAPCFEAINDLLTEFEQQYL
ncbi:MAG: aromatic amino acid hydroxylase [Vampirovibrionales bacterium]|nr:aromatic amino acid hydroxylase [Vampirovibrionales bacterium]